MSLEIYDSLYRTNRKFEPLHAGQVGIYLCGATVQGSPHIGHMRASVAFDVLVRWLRRLGYKVTLVRNVTDIDDKILAKSAAHGEPWWAWGYHYEREFTQAYEALGVLPPTYEPRATGHIPQMLQLVQDILDNGHAYLGENGNVYFDVKSLPDYGSLTRQKLSHMVADEGEAEPDKRNPHDFALWKGSKPGEPETASWDAPWGRGRPGWHLECSAMATHYLGNEFDIHAGGIDLRFPHHENEQAQAHAAGRPFARLWMHNAWVTVKGEKMGKSLGNALEVKNILREVPAVVLRFALGTVHYRSTVEYSPETLAEAAAVWERLAGFVERSVDAVGEVDADAVATLPLSELPAAFVDSMNDDLNVSGALAAIHEEVRHGNNALAERDDPVIRQTQTKVRAMLDVLGLDPLAAPWRDRAGTNASGEALSKIVESLLAQRAEARAEKDWARADSLRDTLTAAGVIVEDSPDGARWHLETA
ncbi:cysteinyl-tRNA synthetase [Actinobaculum suis]|uniref:Cysteine--tRNA ligase n=1 Tax=Actinobaculum suis TaxID=1657 RepID=A0A1B9BEJ3_9ACTO|nr:cysteine--tRNA ligase [Actinobaculum suis]MDY5153702.1 cysteine--tRNA ligase [Actinobaculum suis]OCA95345.1 cysteine--tRNA ligase [Actinobaculum suis]OCA95930.1 cysteine--tRNA ligase [Actinobaculum suis]SDE62279.1 cysteinyl-tRNA synthetase [Actinobaculum suis]VDG75683.1 cysteinyl-tRNA synthetase [Actinobaculum suis]